MKFQRGVRELLQVLEEQAPPVVAPPAFPKPAARP